MAKVVINGLNSYPADRTAVQNAVNAASHGDTIVLRGNFKFGTLGTDFYVAEPGNDASVIVRKNLDFKGENSCTITGGSYAFSLGGDCNDGIPPDLVDEDGELDEEGASCKPTVNFKNITFVDFLGAGIAAKGANGGTVKNCTFTGGVQHFSAGVPGAPLTVGIRYGAFLYSFDPEDIIGTLDFHDCTFNCNAQIVASPARSAILQGTTHAGEFIEDVLFTVEAGVNDKLLVEVNGDQQLEITLTAGVDRNMQEVNEDIAVQLGQLGQYGIEYRIWGTVEPAGFGQYRFQMATVKTGTTETIELLPIANSAYTLLGFPVSEVVAGTTGVIGAAQFADSPTGNFFKGCSLAVLNGFTNAQFNFKGCTVTGTVFETMALFVANNDVVIRNCTLSNSVYGITPQVLNIYMLDSATADLFLLNNTMVSNNYTGNFGSSVVTCQAAHSLIKGNNITSLVGCLSGLYINGSKNTFKENTIKGIGDHAVIIEQFSEDNILESLRIKNFASYASDVYFAENTSGNKVHAQDVDDGIIDNGIGNVVYSGSKMPSQVRQELKTRLKEECSELRCFYRAYRNHL